MHVLAFGLIIFIEILLSGFAKAAAEDRDQTTAPAPSATSGGVFAQEEGSSKIVMVQVFKYGNGVWFD